MSCKSPKRSVSGSGEVWQFIIRSATRQIKTSRVIRQFLRKSNRASFARSKTKKLPFPFFGNGSGRAVFTESIRKSDGNNSSRNSESIPLRKNRYKCRVFSYNFPQSKPKAPHTAELPWRYRGAIRRSANETKKKARGSRRRSDTEIRERRVSDTRFSQRTRKEQT